MGYFKKAVFSTIILSSNFVFAQLGNSPLSLKNQCVNINYSGIKDDFLLLDYKEICKGKAYRDCKPTPQELSNYFIKNKSSMAAQQYFNQDQLKNVFAADPWLLSRMISETYRELGVIRITSIGLKGFANVGGKSYDEIKTDLKTVFSDEFYKTYKFEFPKGNRYFEPSLLKAIFQTSYKASKNEETQIDYDDQKFKYVCLRYTPLHADGCFKNMKRLLAEYYKGPRVITALGATFMADLMSSSKPELGARKAAQKLINKFLNKTVGGDLYSDVYSSYIESGYSQAEAEKWTWDLIYLAIHHGANGYQYKSYYVQPYNVWTLSSALVISSISSYLDSINMQAKGKMYSIPSNVETACDNGKAYHFWVSAYSARNSIQNGFSKEASRWAPFLMSMGYQMLSKSYGRNPAVYLNKGRYGDSNLKNRLDLAYSSAGAEFGINPKAKKISMDDKFNVSLFMSIDPASRNFDIGEPKVASMQYILEWLLMMQPSIIQAN